MPAIIQGSQLPVDESLADAVGDGEATGVGVAVGVGVGVGVGVLVGVGVTELLEIKDSFSFGAGGTGGSGVCGNCGGGIPRKGVDCGRTSVLSG